MKVPFTYRVPGGDDQEAKVEGWPAALAGFPLGQWIADARRFYARGDMDEDRVQQLRSWAWCGRTSTSHGKRAWPPRAGGLRKTGISWHRWTPPTRATG
ncbi:helicase associated domain-containing protein [Streptomyces cynarae]|uniref:helicase associated domain-containing protein n=1 Tax=Streptomyces cynarae TaxID=2981134 RepID=UPI0028BDAF09|nr:helicase associated domain-containing protein [Streptomyces cynarae]